MSRNGGKQAGFAPTPGSRPAEGRAATVSVDDLSAVLSAATAEQFFAATTTYLTRTLGVAYAFIASLEPDGHTVRTLSLNIDQQAADNIRYDLVHTPCATVLQLGFCSYDQKVQQAFPEDDLLVKLGIESYCGKLLLSPEGEALGLLVVMDRKPLADVAYVESLVRIFSDRAGSALVRQLHEQQLRESQRIHATLLSNLPGMVYRCRNDSDWTSIFASEGSLALTGYPPEYFVSHRVNFGELIHPDDRRMVWEQAQVAIREKLPFRISYRIRSADGREKWVSEYGQGVSDDAGQLVALEGFITDITERRQAEQALQQSETNFRALTENANVGILVNHNGRHVLANPPLCRLLGYTPEEMTRTGIRDLVHPGEVDKVLRRFHDRQTGKPVPTTYETVFVARDGRPVPVEVTATTTRWHGEPAGLVFVQDIRGRKQAEQALAQSERQYRALMQEAADGIFIADSEGNYVNVNPRGCQMVGYREDELLRMNMKDLIPAGDPPPQLALIRSARSIMLERRLRHKDGHPVDVEISATMLEDGRLQSIVRDITQRKRAEAEMLKLSSAVDQTADSVLITDVNGLIEYVNPAFEHNTGYTSAEAVGQTPRLVKSGQHEQAFYEKLWATILAGKVFRAVVTNRRKDGSLYSEEKTITPIRDENRRITHFVSTGQDITERMQVQQRLQYLAYHDVLTGLPNRTLFMDRLEHALRRAPRTPRSAAVLFLDVDRFKVINDTLGHDIGDRLLHALAERLKSCVRDADTVARLSGDEFAILLEDLSSTDDVVRVARKILQAFANPFDLGDRELFVTTSIGVSIYPEDGKSDHDLLKSADTAMYRAKEAGRNTYQFYSPDMSARAVERLALETGLRRALERRELVLYYQPIVDMGTRRIVAVEALLRWQQPELGLIPPAEFIGLLEETGMIVPVGEWVIDSVAEQLARWKRAGRSLRISVNLSARQFINKDFVNQVVSLAQQQRLDPKCLEFEITESILMQNAQDTLDLLTRLDSLGCRLAIDDFGTGYSSLSYLKRLPIDVLKIDRSFVRDVPDDKDDASIVSTIVAMAHNLKLTVVAEGVESEKQLTFLRACGCDLMQGTFYSRALPLDELERLLDQDLPLRG